MDGRARRRVRAWDWWLAFGLGGGFLALSLTSPLMTAGWSMAVGTATFVVIWLILRRRVAPYRGQARELWALDGGEECQTAELVPCARLDQLAATMMAADRALSVGAIDAVRYELIWGMVYNELDPFTADSADL